MKAPPTERMREYLVFLATHGGVQYLRPQPSTSDMKGLSARGLIRIDGDPHGYGESAREPLAIVLTEEGARMATTPATQREAMIAAELEAARGRLKKLERANERLRKAKPRKGARK